MEARETSGGAEIVCAHSSVAEALADAGAVGSIYDSDAEIDGFSLGSRGQQRIAARHAARGRSEGCRRRGASPGAGGQHGTMFSATFNPAEAEKLFAGTGHTFAEILALADAQKPLPRFDLKKSLTASVVTENSSRRIAEYRRETRRVRIPY